MKIIDGIKELVGRPAQIPDCSRDDLPEFFKKQGYRFGIELGVYKGEYTLKLLKAGMKIYGVDPYGNYVSKHKYPDYRERQQFLKEHTDRLLEPYIKSGQYVLIRKTSMDALKDFKDFSLDFIYIDGDHRFKYIAEDLYHWTWKVRKGGTISGHDYFNTAFKDDNGLKHRNNIIHVGAIVDAYTRCFHAGSWFLLGRKHRVEGEKRDRWLSWLWIKE